MIISSIASGDKGRWKSSDISRVLRTSLTETLSSIAKEKSLGNLSLRGTEISKLPSSLQKLRYLETLDIEDTKVTKLPHGIFKLDKLRYLLAGVNFSKDLLQKLVQPEMNNKNTNMLGNMAPFLCCNRMDYCNITKMNKSTGIVNY